MRGSTIARFVLRQEQFALFLLITLGIFISSLVFAQDETNLVRLFPRSWSQWDQISMMDLEIVSDIPSPELVDVLMTPSLLREIEAAGIDFEILLDATRYGEADTLFKSNRDQIAIDPAFHTYEEVGSELDSLAHLFPLITKLETLGYSQQEGRSIWALKISDNPMLEEDEPAVLYDGVHHACEIMGLEICLYMISHLLDHYGTDPTVTCWIDNTEIWFVPLLNPDGHFAVTSDINTFWRKNGRELNDNEIPYEYDCNDWWTCFTEGANLNRNYDFNWDTGGSGDPWHYDYRGESPFSESENRALRDLAREQKFIFSISYHSYGELVFYPWNWSGNQAPDDDVCSAVASRIASRIPGENGGTYNATRNGALSGMSANWLYGELGTIDFMVEVNPYPVFIPDGSHIEEIAERNMNGALVLLDQIRGPGLTGHITEAGTGTPLEAVVKVLERYSSDLTPRTSDPGFGRYYRILLPGTYTIEISREGYQTLTLPNVTVVPDDLIVLDAQLAPGDHLSLIGSAIDDDSQGESKGNGDGQINFGEQIELSVEIENPEEVPVYDVSGSLHCDDPYVIMIDSLETIGHISGGTTVDIQSGFIFSISTDVPDKHELEFILTMQDGLSRGWVDTLFLTAVAPDLKYLAWSVIDSSGDNDQIADPAETVDLSITLMNSGGQEAETVSGILSSEDPYVTITTDQADYGDIRPGKTGLPATPFTLSVSPQCPASYTIVFHLEISGAGTYTRTASFGIAIGTIVMGDINLDGTVNILDVLAGINAILEIIPLNQLQMSAADTNGDGTLNMLDIVQLVNIILVPG